MNVEAATEEMMKAWSLVREQHPSDHAVNAERLLKAAFSKLNTDLNSIVSAENLQRMYSQIR